MIVWGWSGIVGGWSGDGLGIVKGLLVFALRVKTCSILFYKILLNSKKSKTIFKSGLWKFLGILEKRESSGS